MSNNIIRGYRAPDAMLRQIERTQAKSGKTSPKSGADASFRSLLERELTFSKHANLRSEQRNIRLDGEQIHRLEGAIDKAQSKGVRDALVVMDGSAFIVNADSRTVVTVLAQEEMKENVFTNIDGAVFV